jgi:hypothetical protein
MKGRRGGQSADRQRQSQTPFWSTTNPEDGAPQECDRGWPARGNELGERAQGFGHLGGIKSAERREFRTGQDQDTGMRMHAVDAQERSRRLIGVNWVMHGGP